MPWYRVGSVAITAGQTTVTGTGTAFSANSRVGDAFQGPDGRWYEVTNIASGTVLSILPAYQGATVTGGSYGLAPMQGYVKESADRLRQTVEQFGATLALLGTPSSPAQLRENIGAAARGVNSDITSLTGMTTALSVAQGGTGGGTPAAARTGLGLKSAALADIVGIVSQSGGVPTGAIVEQFSSANGDCTKFADGTMIASVLSLSLAFSTVNFLQATWVTPATFAAPPKVFATQNGNIPSFKFGRAVPATIGQQQSSVIRLIAAQGNAFTSGETANLQVLAIGRWY